MVNSIPLHSIRLWRQEGVSENDKKNARSQLEEFIRRYAGDLEQLGVVDLVFK
jgi:hypothetical protein